MTKLAKQLSICDIYTDCTKYFEEDKPKLLKLLSEHINIYNYIPQNFINAFYKTFGRKRKYKLYSFLSMLILQKILSIPSDSLLLTILNNSKELRELCGLTQVPDASKITRFKTTFIAHLELMFNNLVKITEPICKKINAKRASMLIFDTTGIEAHVTENNPKYLNYIIKNLKKQYKNESDVYKIAYSRLPATSKANETIRHMYVNGHFCYAHKFGILTNGLGIIRHIESFDSEFKLNNPEVLGDKTDDPDQDKTVSDSKALKPILEKYIKTHGNNHTTFLGDAAFDNYDTYSYLLNVAGFKRALIPLKKRSSKLTETDFDENGFPLCPQDKTPFKMIGVSGEKKRRNRIKFCCPKSVHKGHSRTCLCENPCTPSKYGRTVYVDPESNLRLYPGTIRGTQIWENTYKIRTVIEQTINSVKENMCVGDRKTRNEKTIKSDLLIAAITQLLIVVLADNMDKLKDFKAIKRLIA